MLVLVKYTPTKSVPLATDASQARLVQVGGVVAVHGCVNAFVMHVVQVLVIQERVVGRCKHFAHVVCLFAEKGILLTAHTNIAALVAPGLRSVPPLESFLAGGIAHTTAVQRLVCD